MEAVVNGVDYVGVFEDIVLLEALYGTLDKIINRLQSLETASVVKVVILHIFHTLPGHVTDSAGPARLAWIQIIGSRDSDIGEEILVSLS